MNLNRKVMIGAGTFHYSLCSLYHPERLVSKLVKMQSFIQSTEVHSNNDLNLFRQTVINMMIQ